MKIFIPCLAVVTAVCVTFLAGCATDPRFDDSTVYLGDVPQRAVQDPERASFDNISYWDGNGVTGPPKIVVRLSEQRAYFYKGGQLVGISIVSTGREGYNTKTGNFKIMQKNIDHRSNLYGNYVDATTGQVVVKDVDVRTDKKPPGTTFSGAPMPYFMRVVGGIGMHEGFLPGYAASHGCIRMPKFMAQNFFASVEKGTPVTITH